MKIGASAIIDTAESTRGQSSSCSLPVRKRVCGMRPIELNMRNESCSHDISMLKIAAGTLLPSAAFSAMLIASVVFPIDGRPAMMMSSPRCSPDVILSISAKPVDTPVISLVEWLKKSIRSIVFGRMDFNDWKPGPRRPPSAISNTRCSARSTMSAAVSPSVA